MNLLQIAAINLKKRRRDSISLLLLIFIASLFLNVGVKNIIISKNCLLDKMKETRAVENSIILKESIYKESYLNYLKDDARVSNVIVKKIICMPTGYLYYKGGNIKDALLFLDSETNESFEHVKLEANDSQQELAIYAPLYLENYGFQKNDAITMKYNNVTYTFHIAGFYETTLYGNMATGGLKFIATNETMDYLKEELGTAVMIGVNCHDIDDCQKVHSDFMKHAMLAAETGNSFDTIIDNSYQDNNETYSFKSSILSILITAFSIVIVILVLLVIRVRISNHIEEHLTSIGTMGALGYTKNQIQIIYTYEYLLTSMIGVVLGTVVAYAGTPFVNHVFQMISGLIYKNKMYPIVDLCCFVGIELCVVLMSLRSSNRVKKYPPVIAFRKGRKAHDFKKNYFDICKEQGNLNVKLAGKSIIAAIKQHILVVCCIAGVTFVAVFGAIMYSCFVKDTNTLKRIAGMEIADIGLEVEKSADIEAIEKKINEMKGINYTITYDVAQVLIDNSKLFGYVCNDFTKVRTINCYEGSFPTYEDEVVITGVLAEKLGKGIGDTVDISQGGYSATYMITGLTQTMTYSGQILMMTTEGIKRIQPNFEPSTLYVYLEQGVDIEETIGKMKETFGTTVTDLTVEGIDEDNTDQYTHLKKEAEKKISVLLSNYDVQNVDYSLYIDGVTITGSSKKYEIKQIDNLWKNTMSAVVVLQTAIKVVMVGISIAIFLIIIIILSLVIRTMIIHRKEEFGVYKAIGYTSGQLRIQIAISMLPSVFIGSALGSVFAYLFVNPMASSLFHATGISSIQMVINPFVVIGINLLITMFSFIIAMYVARKVKNITVYELMKE